MASITRTEEIRELYEYNDWANQRMLKAATELTQEEFARDLRNSFPTVGDTLAHILGAEWIWLERWRGVSPPGFPDSWDTSTPAALRARWEEFTRGQSEFVRALNEERLNSIVNYRTVAGKPFSDPLWRLMRHVANHSTYHRGQVTTMLRQLGKSAPVTDLIQFYRERGIVPRE